MKEKDILPRCRKCGDTVPVGKELCWCCEHTPKLHIDNKEECSKDSCTIVYDKH